MNRIAGIAGAATAVAAAGLLGVWLVFGGSATIAFAAVIEALENIRTATYDETAETKRPLDGTPITIHSKTMFLAPSHQRPEISTSAGSAKDVGSIMIFDTRAMKCFTLAPNQKLATVVDLTKVKKPAGSELNMFETVRALVREGKSGGAGKVESLGKKEIDGQAVVGFRTASNAAEMTIWADSRTARPVRIELSWPIYNNSHGVMSNFRYDMELEPGLFSLEPPAGYTVNEMQAANPVEEDLVDLLRLVAKYHDGLFPPAIGTNKEYAWAIEADALAEAQKLAETPEGQKLLEQARTSPGDDQGGRMKEWLKFTAPMTQKALQKHMQGVLFYAMLQPENDAHYAGKGVKLGTADRPIFWYKPTGAAKYRVIYADLSVKELAPDEVGQLPDAKAN